MPHDSANSLTCEDPLCQGPLLLALLDETKSLSAKMDTILQLSGKIDAIYQTLKKENPKANRVSKENICNLCTNELVVALQLKYPEKVWKSNDFAKEIGCTASAVRHTRAWKDYLQRCQNERQQHIERSRYGDSNFEVFGGDENADS